MQLWRRGNYEDQGEPKLVDIELEGDAGYSSDPDVTGYACGFDGKEFFLGMCGIPDVDRANTTHWYTLTLTPREMRVLLSRSLWRNKEIPNAEQALWETFFELWEKRVEAKDEEGDE